MKSPLPHLTLSALLLALFFSGCVQKSTENTAQIPDLSIENEELQTTNQQLTKQLTDQKYRNTMLEKRLLKQHGEIDNLTQVNEQLVKEVVRNKAMVRHRTDKVETVRILAELETILRSLHGGGEKGQQIIDRIRQYIKQSKGELDKGNLGGANYLANKAQEQARSFQMELSSDTKGKKNKITGFVTPMQMTLLGSSNVRAKPSLQAKINYVLSQGNTVMATGYQGDWVRIRGKKQEDGWIHSTLLSGAWK
ncbi:MAG: SH3 domain-containing protein [Thermodesulfobacteriota bacterium]